MSAAIPVLLIPGLNCSARVFLQQLPALWQHGPVTVADTRRGESMAAIAATVLASAPPRFALAGFSMGGYVALEILRQAPERVLSLALLATNARTDTEEQRQKRLQRIDRVEDGDFEGDLREQFPFSVHPDHADDTGLFATYRAMALDAGSAAFLRHVRAIMARRDQRDLLPSINCPTLIVAGDADQIMSQDMTDELAREIPAARLMTLPQCGHFLPIEQPDRLTQVLVQWLRADG